MQNILIVDEKGIAIPSVCLKEGESSVVIGELPVRETRENCRPELHYSEDRGAWWEYIAITPKELRERSYRTVPCISWQNKLFTVDQANKLWQEYQAEGSSIASELTTLIAEAKAAIREKLPD